ncbi:MAG TPA: CrcB family protein [Pseudolysinimonas sp.]|nr:CrcB family protein [Pseudolysinimonas sp.]
MSTVIVLATLAAGAVGALVRYAVSVRAAASVNAGAASSGMPWAVLIVNSVGSLVAGVGIGLADVLAAPDLRAILVSGFAAGLTTFSTFSVETVQLVLTGRARTAALSVAANLVAGVGAVLLGWTVVTASLG